jgi:hypothetical protein
MYYIRRVREKYGTVRVSTAYQFFEAVEEHLIFVHQDYTNREKPPFEATNYLLYYYAANEADEIGKERISYTLDRKEMWNCTAAKGTMNTYEFVGLPPTTGGDFEILMRDLPCPCDSCLTGSYAECSNSHIVGAMENCPMKEIPPIDVPALLTAPINTNTIPFLKAFIKQYKDKLPKVQSKTALIKFITDELSEYIIMIRNCLS